MSFNKCILQGRLTADAELKQTQSGTAVTSFTLAVDRRYKKGEEKKCDFISVVAWKQNAEFVCKYFKKGQAMIVCGEIQNRSWEDKNGNKRITTEVIASEVSFVDSRSEAQPTTPTNFVPDAYQPSTFTMDQVDIDQNLPF